MSDNEIYDDDDDLDLGEDDDYEEDEAPEKEDIEDDDKIIEDLDECNIVADIDAFKKLNITPDNINSIYKHVSKFEMTSVIGTRAEQISRGAPVYVEIPDGMTDPIEIAIIEWREKKIPMTIIRDFNSKGAGKYSRIEYTLDSLIQFEPVY
jgi:DNA-directed RNA polymerase subunit K/omega